MQRQPHLSTKPETSLNNFMNMPAAIANVPCQRSKGTQIPFAFSREFMGNRFVYAVVSSRARGLSVGVNMNPDCSCNFDCWYCEVRRRQSVADLQLDVELMGKELSRTIEVVNSGQLRDYPAFANVPEDLLQLRHVALSGDGEPTLCPRFSEAVQTVAHVRAVRPGSYFKIVLITNASGLHLPEVQDGLKYFRNDDEIWAKLEAGTQAYMDQVNRGSVPLEAILANILLVARRRPVIIQSLFPSINGMEPPPEEITAFAGHLRDLKEKAAQIPLVQIYSATRAEKHSVFGHLPLKSLSRIAGAVREIAGLKAEVF
jgi:wyosine [tRNA(Phe)-imidazoG37] synthetase (radical SAM superfamily)